MILNPNYQCLSVFCLNSPDYSEKSLVKLSILINSCKPKKSNETEEMKPTGNVIMVSGYKQNFDS